MAKEKEKMPGWAKFIFWLLAIGGLICLTAWIYGLCVGLSFVDVFKTLYQAIYNLIHGTNTPVDEPGTNAVIGLLEIKL